MDYIRIIYIVYIQYLKQNVNKKLYHSIKTENIEAIRNIIQGKRRGLFHY